MSTEPEEVEVPEVEERPRLLSVEIGDWPGLGGNVGFTLGERRTVLVGRNGAGKSLLIDGVWKSITAAILSPPPEIPGFFRCEVAFPGTFALRYEYRVAPEEALDRAPHTLEHKRARRRRVPSWSERCWRSDTGAELWRIADATIVQPGAEPRPFPHGEGLLVTVDSDFDGPREISRLVDFLAGVEVIPAGIPRWGEDREEIVLPGRRDDAGTHDWMSGGTHLDELARRILFMWEQERERFDELAELLRQLSLVRDLEVEIYTDANPNRRPPRFQQDYAAVLFDGVNLGLCSDGTQRVVDILSLLIHDDLTCLLLEEPETAVHPRLLRKLLGVIESYSFDRQVVISTHSPEVVDWCAPKDLRIVERIEGTTRVLPLEREEIARAHRYLAHEGNFSEFVYWRSDA